MTIAATAPDSPAAGPFTPRHGRHAAAARARRALPPEQVRAVRLAADVAPRQHRRALPRWHRTNHAHELADQLSTEPSPGGGPSDAELYGAVHGKAWVWRYNRATGRREPVREGTTSRLPWLSRERYCTVTVGLRLAQADADGILQRNDTDAATFRRWVREESKWADQRTGRRCVVRPLSVAEMMEVSERTVQRCRSAARDLGLYATIHRGRMLRQIEQVRARWAGSSQRGMAAESWFVVPPDLAISTATVGRSGTVSYLQRGSGQGHFSNLPQPLVTVTTRGKKEPAPPAARSKRRKRAPSPGYQLAERVLQRISWTCGCPAGRLAGVLSPFATSRYPWNADDIVRHIDTTNLRRGWSAISNADELRAPAFALLASYLRDADPDADHPRLIELEAADRRGAAAAARAEHRRGGCWVPASADTCCGIRFA